MIVVDRAKIRFLLAGRTLDVPNPDGRARPYRKGRSYALGTSHRRSLFRVEIVELDRERQTMRVKLSNDDSPRLLAARSQYGYTDKLHRALRGEREAVSEQAQEQITKDAQARRRQELAAFRGRLMEEADALSEGATRADVKRLRALRRIASSL